jgi:hypothetical protein
LESCILFAGIYLTLDEMVKGSEETDGLTLYSREEDEMVKALKTPTAQTTCIRLMTTAILCRSKH